MSQMNVPLPTDAELAILQVLWARGPCTVRDVYEQLSQDRPIGYTTVLKLLQIMTDKGLVVRDESQRAHVYEARAAEAETQTRLVDDLLSRAFAGSAEKLVLRALTAQRTSPEELERIRTLLDELKGGRS
ncbi:MAG: BlaI/MecI/CopY family transcriptional regulator [Candidatus Latescibacteria bacterium]|nr:BlaI/MecI/CopY family transcriptional regulator [Candidatus Latescibacterota bacterium]